MRSLVSQDRQVASHLKLEITEGQVMSNPEHSAYMLSALKAMGLRLALDDFGTGHSSLSYLHRFPVDTIKIPAPFVQMADDSGLAHTQVPIIRSIIALATELDLLVIAEGVETLEEIERLQQLNCQFAQGFAFGAAMNGSEFGKKFAAQLGR
jgi:EAL domain-containing protein (putative c-di-GMP-specific phosphodiesterase class I)